MQLRSIGFAFASAPARVATGVLGGFVILMGVLFAVRPEMMMSVVHMMMSTP